MYWASLFRLAAQIQSLLHGAQIRMFYTKKIFEDYNHYFYSPITVYVFSVCSFANSHQLASNRPTPTKYPPTLRPRPILFSRLKISGMWYHSNFRSKTRGMSTFPITFPFIYDNPCFTAVYRSLLIHSFNRSEQTVKHWRKGQCLVFIAFPLVPLFAAGVRSVSMESFHIM